MDKEDVLDLVGYRVSPLVAGRYRIVDQSDEFALPYCSCKAVDTISVTEVHLDILLKHWRGAVALRREFAALRNLQHPSILNAHEFLEDEQVVVLATEWLDARSLSTLVCHQRPAVGDAIEILAELATAIEYAHARDIPHHALTPHCVFVRHCRSTANEPRLKIRGFDHIESRRNSERVGSLNDFLSEISYAAPEMFSNTSRPGRAADVYSLGVIAFSLLANRMPFESDVPHELMIMHRESQPPRASDFADIPSWLDQLIVNCLEKHPENRPRSSEVASLLRSQNPCPPASRQRNVLRSLRIGLQKNYSRLKAGLLSR